MALCLLGDDALGVVLEGLCNPLEPRNAVGLGSVSHRLRALTQALREQLRTEHEVVAALCRTLGLRSCKELREAKKVDWGNNDLFALGSYGRRVARRFSATADLTTLGTLGLLLPALQRLSLACFLGHDSVQQLAAELGAGALPALILLTLRNMHVGDAGASALAAALGRGALPRLRNLSLMGSALGNAGLVALAPALRQLPGLEAIDLGGNPVGDEGISALLAPPLAASAPRPPTVGLAKLKVLILENIQITDAGCAALASVIDNGALPALEQLGLQQEEPWTAASPAAVDAVLQVLVRACHRHHTKAHSECRMCWQYGPTQVSHS